MSPSAKTFTPKQGQYLAYIHLYTRLHRWPPAEADIQQYFRVAPPSALTPGNTADCVVAETCVSLIPASLNLWPTRDMTPMRFVRFLKERGIKTVIPGKSNRKKRSRHDK